MSRPQLSAKVATLRAQQVVSGCADSHELQARGCQGVARGSACFRVGGAGAKSAAILMTVRMGALNEIALA